MRDYVERRDGGLYLADSRISLDSIVYAFKNGASPESILRSFPLIGTLETVYGALTFYLANQPEVEAYLGEQESLWEQMEARQTPLLAEVADRLQQTRDEAAARRT